jgi:hypothetical protein
MIKNHVIPSGLLFVFPIFNHRTIPSGLRAWGESPKGRKKPGVFAAGLWSEKMRESFIQDGERAEFTFF